MKQPAHLSVFFRLLLILVMLPVPLCAEPSFQEPSANKEINAVIVARQHPYLKLADFSNRSEDLDALYKLGNYELLWLGKTDSTHNVNEALTLLANALNEGLNPEDYDAASLRERFSKIAILAPTGYKELALYDTALSIALLRYLHDLHYGRVSPQQINYNIKLREKKLLDLPALVKQSVTLKTVAGLSLQTEPKLKQYQQLKAALSVYRALAEATPFRLVMTNKLRPGETHPQLAELGKFLVDVGDLPPYHPPSENTEKKPKYMPELVEGVKKFQRRHGLVADGTLGSGTVEAINEPLSNRVAQIEWAMERLRWLPELPNSGRSIVVNIPAFQLWAIDGAVGERPNITQMRVVVGKALKSQTPVLMAQMSFVEFMPYWNVPKTIMKDEILPKLVRRPGFLASQNMEIVSSFGNSAKAVAVSKDSIEKLKKGLLRVRQRPGARNSLGKIKFIFPNKDDVYLHDTPSTSLFSKSRRDFSHGCVRVEDPRALAEFALRNQGKWNPDTIKKAMKNPANQQVVLQQPIPVLFFYTTAFVDQDNNLGFYPDIYGHDDTLKAALNKADDLDDQSIFVSARETVVAPAAKP